MQKKVEVSNFVDNMIRRFLLSLAASIICLCAVAQSFQSQGINYRITDENSCVVTGSETNEYSGSITIPGAVVFGGREYIVRGVDDYAFQQCVGLTEINLPASATYVGKGGFYGCTSLYSFSGPALGRIDRSAFSGCRSLESFVFPEGLEYLGDSSFRGCSALTSAVLPDNLELGQYVFSGCTSLVSASLSSSIDFLPDYTFSDCISLVSVEGMENIDNIGDYAFKNCSSLNSLSLNKGLRSVGSHAFSMCSSLVLNSIDGNGLTLSDFAFEGCNGLSNITLNGIYEIGEESFANCISLQKVSMDAGVKYIRERAFRNCNTISVVNCRADQPPFMASNAFGTMVYEYATLEVPAGRKLLYMQSPPWSNFLNVQETGDTGIKDLPEDDSNVLKVICKGDMAEIFGPSGYVQVFSSTGLKVYESNKTEESICVPLRDKGIYVAVVNGKSVKFRW